LVDNLGGAVNAGGKLKESDTTHWISPNTGANNESGFIALTGGYRHHPGKFETIGFQGWWWSTAESSPANQFGLLRLQIYFKGIHTGIQ